MKNRQYLEDLSKGNCIPPVNVINLGGRGGGSDRKSSCLTDVTYSQLVALIGANGLLAGCNYRITDFRTRELIPNTTDIIVGSIEPLIVQATTRNSIDNTNVLSTVYPQDRIYYEVINSTTSADDRGRIYYREETILDVIAGYNWRVSAKLVALISMVFYLVKISFIFPTAWVIFYILTCLVIIILV